MATTAALADTMADLTPQWFTTIFRESQTIGANESVRSVDARLFGTGQFGLVVQATLDYDSDAGTAPQSVIVKLPSEDAGSRGLAAAIGAYEAEVCFYQQVAPRSSIALPQIYWGGFESTTARVSLVLEDLSSEWRVGDAIAGGSDGQTAAAIDQIARLHGELWDDPQLRRLEWLAPLERTQALFNPVPEALPLFNARFADRLEPRHRNMIQRLAPRGAQYPGVAWRGPQVVTHGDFRLDNVLFRGTEENPIAAVIDWQAVRLGPPMIDSAVWMASSWSTGRREGDVTDLVRRYHHAITEAGVRDYSFEQCMGNLQICSLYVLLLGVGTSVALQQSERGDAMFAAMIASAADLVIELGGATTFEKEL